MTTLRALSVSLALILLAGPAFAADSDFEEEYEQNSEEWAAQRARRAHEMAASDVIYQQEDLRAIYYQNQQLIEIMKDVRDTQKETLRLLQKEASENDSPEENG